MSEYRNGLISMLHSNLVALDCAAGVCAKVKGSDWRVHHRIEETQEIAQRAVDQILKEMDRILTKLEKE